MKKIITILTMLFMLSLQSYAKEFPSMNEVPVDNVFTITFNDAIDSAYVNSNYFSVYESISGNPVSTITYTVSDDLKIYF